MLSVLTVAVYVLYSRGCVNSFVSWFSSWFFRTSKGEDVEADMESNEGEEHAVLNIICNT